MICESCHKNPASVHITEAVASNEASGGAQSSFVQKHLCEQCANQLDLPHMPKSNPTPSEIWKLIQSSAMRMRREDVTCGACGMTLSEFRTKGRLGCAKDYELFGKHLAPMLIRMHNASAHVGRIPGAAAAATDPEAQRRTARRRIRELRTELAAAIKEERYESAARLRDELEHLEAEPPG
jgi:protein arginine kinase activator